MATLEVQIHPKMRSFFLVSLTVLSVLIFGSTSVHAQDDESGSLSSGTIESQYDFMWESSNRYQDHRVIKTAKLSKFKSNVLDSLSTLQTTIDGLENTIKNQNSRFSGKQSEIDSLAFSLESAVKS